MGLAGVLPLLRFQGSLGAGEGKQDPGPGLLFLLLTCPLAPWGGWSRYSHAHTHVYFHTHPLTHMHTLMHSCTHSPVVLSCPELFFPPSLCERLLLSQTWPPP